MELLIIAAILFVLVGIPIIVVVVVLVILNRSKASTRRDEISREADTQQDIRR